MKVIAKGNVVARRGKRRTEVDADGKVVRRLGHARNRASAGPLSAGPLFPDKVRCPPPTASVLGSGWIAYGIWENNSGSPVTLFKTRWIVPPNPTNPQNGQAIMLFNGIQNAQMILQPVLQWGVSALGGGDYWAVASWLAGPPGQVFYRSQELVPVQTGDVLDAVITLTSGTPPGPYNYNCQFIGIDGTSLDVENEDELTHCVETLEAYGITNGFDYPDSCNLTAMSDIQVQTGGADANLDWKTVNAVIACGEHVNLVSNASPGGELQLFY